MSATAQTVGELDDYEAITAQPLYAQATAAGSGRGIYAGVVTSIHGSNRALGPDLPHPGPGQPSRGQGYLYMEMNLDLLGEALAPYSELNACSLPTPTAHR